MRCLFTLDTGDHDACTHTTVRPSARSIIITGKKIALIHSLKYDYYKFPGGGIEPGEDPLQALIRETREEAGLTVIPQSIREYGCVHRVQRGVLDRTELFIQDNYYYFCQTEEQGAAQKLDGYEAAERFTLEYMSPLQAIGTNLGKDHGPKDKTMILREARVLELLIKEGYFK